MITEGFIHNPFGIRSSAQTEEEYKRDKKQFIQNVFYKGSFPLAVLIGADLAVLYSMNGLPQIFGPDNAAPLFWVPFLGTLALTYTVATVKERQVNKSLRQKFENQRRQAISA